MKKAHSHILDGELRSGEVPWESIREDYVRMRAPSPEIKAKRIANQYGIDPRMVERAALEDEWDSLEVDLEYEFQNQRERLARKALSREFNSDDVLAGLKLAYAEAVIQGPKTLKDQKVLLEQIGKYKSMRSWIEDEPNPDREEAKRAAADSASLEELLQKALRSNGSKRDKDTAVSTERPPRGRSDTTGGRGKKPH